MTIDPRTRIGAVRLTVADLDRAAGFYERVVGMRSLRRDGDTALLGTNSSPVVELVGRPDAPPRKRGTTGLFHTAILVPSREELGRSLRRVAGARWPLAGASDHLVSEALYLEDTEGNGIEIYRDRPREEWRYEHGRLQMATLPLDLRSMLRKSTDEGEDPPVMSGRTRIGHVHLQVADLAAAEAFYRGILGFEVTVGDYPGALFLSAGGYHHHVGLNTWAGEGAPAPEPGAVGLRWFEVVLPHAPELDRIFERLGDARIDVERVDDGVLTADPSGNAVLLRTAGG
jgi:catechol 2,3-dioxygenase